MAGDGTCGAGKHGQGHGRGSGESCKAGPQIPRGRWSSSGCRFAAACREAERSLQPSSSYRRLRLLRSARCKALCNRCGHEGQRSGIQLRKTPRSHGDRSLCRQRCIETSAARSTATLGAEAQGGKVRDRLHGEFYPPPASSAPQCCGYDEHFARAAWTALQRRGHEGIGVLMPAAAHHFNLSFGGMRPKTPRSRPCVTALRTVAQVKPLIQSLG
mmetsp:Transcript_132089/g.313080  ORF Transcript_132089/g.313080 Transcript_132089/m.313080 type:complete len:215 (+) Transcript_132089:3357-4001(+)